MSAIQEASSQNVGLLWLSRIDDERKTWLEHLQLLEFQRSFLLTVMTLRLIRGRKPKWQIPQTPGVYQKISSLARHHPCSQWLPWALPLLDRRCSASSVCLCTSHFGELGRLKITFKVEKAKRGCCLDPSQQPQELSENQSEVFHAVGNQNIMSCCSPVPAQPEVHHEHKPREDWIEIIPSAVLPSTVPTFAQDIQVQSIASIMVSYSCYILLAPCSAFCIKWRFFSFPTNNRSLHHNITYGQLYSYLKPEDFWEGK